MKKLNTIAVAALLLVGMLGCSSCMLIKINTFPCPKGTILSVENLNGFLKITEGGAGEVHVSDKKVVRVGNEAEAKALLKKVHTSIEIKDGHISVKTEYPKRDSPFFSSVTRRIAVNYTIEVPKGTQIEARTVNGDVTIETPSSTVDCGTTNGTIGVSGARLLSASTVNGSVHFKALNVRKVDATNGSVKGEIESLKPVEGGIDTVNGSITVTISAKAAFRLSADSVIGSISSDLIGASGSKHNLVAEVNGGGNTISLETVNGSIKILKKMP